MYKLEKYKHKLMQVNGGGEWLVSKVTDPYLDDHAQKKVYKREYLRLKRVGGAESGEEKSKDEKDVFVEDKYLKYFNKYNKLINTGGAMMVHDNEQEKVVEDLRSWARSRQNSQNKTEFVSGRNFIGKSNTTFLRRYSLYVGKSISSWSWESRGYHIKLNSTHDEFHREPPIIIQYQEELGGFQVIQMMKDISISMFLKTNTQDPEDAVFFTMLVYLLILNQTEKASEKSPLITALYKELFKRGLAVSPIDEIHYSEKTSMVSASFELVPHIEMSSKQKEGGV